MPVIRSSLHPRPKSLQIGWISPANRLRDAREDMKGHEQAVFAFGSFTLVPSERLLLRHRLAVPLTGRAFDLLTALVENAGHLVSKDDLLARVWPGVVVEEVNLSVNISALRKVLSRDAGGGDWIETVPRQGYRFNAPVAVADVATVDLAAMRGLSHSYRGNPAPGGAETPARRRFVPAGVGVGVLALAIAGYGAWRWLHPPAPLPPVKLTASESRALERRPTANDEAYRAYLEGRFHWGQRSAAAMQRAVERFERATQLDPGFALAWAALADAHTARGYLGYVAPVATFPVARPHALKALELDPSLAQAHAALAYIKFYFDWDWAGAREEFLKAIALDPADPTSHQWYAVYLLAAGHQDEAFDEAQAAHRLDPLSLSINTDIGFHHYYSGRYPQALAQLKSVLEMKSDFLLAHLWLARTYVEMGRLDDAFASLALAEPKARGWPVLLAARGYALGVAGRREEARAVLQEMDALSKGSFVTAYGVALVHAGLGEKDEAFRWLEKAFEERSHWLVWLRLDPRWANLRGDPRFAGMVARMGYPQGR